MSLSLVEQAQLSELLQRGLLVADTNQTLLFDFFLRRQENTRMLFFWRLMENKGISIA
jgi:hypothetical protein